MNGAVELGKRIMVGARTLSPVQRILATGLLGAALVGLAVGIAVMARGPRMVPLFTGVEPGDASEIVKILEDRKVPYRLQDGGGTILVPSADVHQSRLMVAGQGLPRSGVVGYEIMDSSRLGATDFERRINYIRALQGELARTIMQIDGIQAARVHVVLPEPSLFVAQSKPATAAVLLKLYPGWTPDKAQVRSVVNLVAKSVEGLKPEQVTVVDTLGRLLSSGMQEGEPGTGQGSGFLDLRRDFEAKLESRLVSLLERVLGPGNVVARVSAELDFDSRVIDRTLFEPVTDQSGILRSMEELRESFRGAGPVPQGAAGMETNIPGYATSIASSEGEYSKSHTVNNYEINQVTERTVIAPGAVKRLSVAVVVNGQLGAPEQAAIEKTVAAAIGFDPERKDQITVTGLSFDTSLVDELRRAAEAQEEIPGPAWAVLWGEKAVPAAIAAAVILVAIFAAVQRRRAAAYRRRILHEQEKALKEAAAAVSPEEREKMLIKEQVERLVAQRPESVAQLIRAWLSED